MIYWLLQEATTAGEQGAALTWPNILTAGVVGAVISFVGLIIGLIFTQRRHTQTLQTTRELEDHRAQEAALQNYLEQVDPLQAEDIANAIVYVVTQPKRVSINELLIRPSQQPN